MDVADFPLPCDQLTLAQGDVLKQFRLLKKLVCSFGIRLPVPDLPHAEEEEPDSISYDLPASGFSLRFGIIFWNEESGPIATLNLWWDGDEDEPVIAVEYKSDAGWYRYLEEFGAKNDSLNRVIAIANALEIPSPDIPDQSMTEMEAMNVADRLVKHYLKHRAT